MIGGLQDDFLSLLSNLVFSSKLYKHYFPNIYILVYTSIIEYIKYYKSIDSDFCKICTI